MLVVRIGLRRDALYVDRFKPWRNALRDLGRNAVYFCGANRSVCDASSTVTPHSAIRPYPRHVSQCPGNLAEQLAHGKIFNTVLQCGQSATRRPMIPLALPSGLT